MRINETSIFTFIAALVLGLLISLNINFKGSAQSIVLSARQYQEAYNTRDKLNREISLLREEYKQATIRLKQYENSITPTAKVLQDISEELEKNSLILGTTEVKGPGVSIEIDDGSLDFFGFITNADIERSLLHDIDILMIMKILRNSGAKAISINGIRVLANSEFICSGAFITVNGIKLPAPYNINVIGNADAIYHYITTEESYLRFIEQFRHIKVSILKAEDLKIPAAIGNIDYRYMNQK
jgi:uncharacterized protein YlxW (UPF0749 family)